MAGELRIRDYMRSVWVGSVCVGLMAAAVVLFSSVGCGRRSNFPNDIPKLIPAPVLGVKLSEEQATDLGFVFEDAVYVGNPVTINRYFSAERFLEFVLAGMTMSDRERDSFRTGFMEEYSRKGIVGMLVDQASDGGEFLFLRAIEREDGWRLVFRVSSAMGTLNYFEFVTELNPANGEPRIVNGYAYGSGEFFSDTVGRFSRALLEKRPRGAFGLRSTEGEEELALLQDIGQLIEQGDWEKALQLYDELPEESRERKEYLLLKLQIALGLYNSTGDSTVHVETLNRFQQLFPSDTSMLLLGIDYYLQQGDYEASVACVKQINERVGGDPFLWKTEIGIWASASDYVKVNQSLEQAIELYPAELDLYWTGMGIAAETQDQELWLRMLEQAEEAGGFDPEGLEAEAAFETFVQDPRYLDWKKRITESIPEAVRADEVESSGDLPPSPESSEAESSEAGDDTADESVDSVSEPMAEPAAGPAAGASGDGGLGGGRRGADAGKPLIGRVA